MTIPGVRLYRLTREIGSLKPDVAQALMSGQAMVDKRLAVMAYPRAVGAQSPGFALLDWNNYYRMLSTCNEHAHTYFAICDHGDGLYPSVITPAPVFSISYSTALGEYVAQMPLCDYLHTYNSVMGKSVRCNSSTLVGVGDEDFVASGNTTNFMLWVDASEDKVIIGGAASTTYFVAGGQFHCEDAEIQQLRILSGGGIVSSSGVDILIAPAYGSDDADLLLGSTGACKIHPGGHIEPCSSANADAPNGTIYYSTDASKLVYKDSGGTVNVLY